MTELANQGTDTVISTVSYALPSGVENLMEGAAFLSARTGAPIVPIGIGGSDLAMPKGSTVPKPYTIQGVIGPAIAGSVHSVGWAERNEAHASIDNPR